MSTTTGTTAVRGVEELEDYKVKRTYRFLFFKTTYWETVSTKHIGNDIHINTDRPIRNIYFNGKIIWNQSQQELQHK